MAAREDVRAARVVVATVNYGSADMVMAAMPALVENLADFDVARAYVVDNASPGDDAERLARFVAERGYGDRVEVIASPVNGGFAAGNNLALKATEALPWEPDCMLLLNPDAVARPGAIAAMVETLLDHPRAGLVGGTLENPDGSTWVAAFNFPSMMMEFAGASGLSVLQRLWPVLARDSDVPHRVDWISGAALMLRMDTLKRLGGLDEGYFLYFEEVDFARRAQRAGWEAWRAPAARVLHDAGSTTGIEHGRPKKGRMPRYWFDSWRRYFERNHGRLYARCAAAMKLAGHLVGEIKARVRGQRTANADRFIGDFARACLIDPLLGKADGDAR